ncbi:hypothetical protein [Thiothrix nivea]|uniref:hypothetical protein n=1 Tax=Thiothrix nivea TaxID=1031 RepID=UPI0012B69670|nr:hypothetical protein [Thiothrix nivea]
MSPLIPGIPVEPPPMLEVEEPEPDVELVLLPCPLMIELLLIEFGPYVVLSILCSFAH